MFSPAYSLDRNSDGWLIESLKKAVVWVSACWHSTGSYDSGKPENKEVFFEKEDFTAHHDLFISHTTQFWNISMQAWLCDTQVINDDLFWNLTKSFYCIK